MTGGELIYLVKLLTAPHIPATRPGEVSYCFL